MAGQQCAATTEWITALWYRAPCFDLRIATHNTDLAENVIEHRQNRRTVYINPISRFIYWNMSYHVEHHMFPMVPYHALPALYDAIKHGVPAAKTGVVDGYREVISAKTVSICESPGGVGEALVADAEWTGALRAEDAISGWNDPIFFDRHFLYSHKAYFTLLFVNLRR